MSESAEDKLSRLRQMTLDDGETWDLSPNDKAAIQFGIELIHSLASSVGEYTGRTAPQVIDIYSLHVQRNRL